MLEKLITEITTAEAEIIEEFCESKFAVRGSILVEQGRTNQDLFFLSEGEIGVYRKLRLGGKITAVKIADVHAPVLIGEANMFMEEERNASILVVEDIKYLHLSDKKFAELKAQHPAIAIKIMEYSGSVISKRYSDMLDHFQSRVVGESESPLKALETLKMCLGPVTVCSTETAKKLFGFTQTYTD